MQTNIQRLSRLFLMAFGLLTLTLIYWQLIRANALSARDDNPRPVVAEQRIQRGAIRDEQGLLLAETIIGPTDLPRRRYRGSAIAPVVGYSSLRYGTGGLEAAFDTILRGDANVTWLSTLMHQAQVGDPISVTLHLPAQLAAASALAEHGTTGAFVVLNAESGAVRVMASHPTFDPNMLETDWDALADDPTAPLLNRATQGLFPLGDLARLIVLLQLAEAGVALPDQAMTMPLEDLLDLTTSNDILATIQQLGLDQPPAFIFPIAAGNVPESLPDDLGETSVTPMHVALLTMAIAGRNGVAAEPYLVSDPRQPNPAMMPMISSETATILHDLQREFTASVPPKITGNEHLSWYVTFTDSSPAYVVVASVTTPDEASTAAQSVAQTVLKALMP